MAAGVVIVAFCIEYGCARRRDDRDFDVRETRLGLKFV